VNELHQPWELLAGRYAEVAGELVAGRPALDPSHREQTIQFARGRLQEGRGIGEFFLRRRGEGGLVLDLGAGDGGATLGIANHRAYRVIASDLNPNGVLRRLADAIELPVMQSAADGHRLPLIDSSIDLVACLDVIEHVPEPQRLAGEILRVLKPGGACMITTPARLRHLLRPDPHFGVRGLLLLPDALQRRAVLGLARRRFGSVDPSLYDVQHIYWHVSGITRLFDGARAEVLWDYDYPGPVSLRDRLWFAARHLLWSRIVIWK
jgi:SAM-dependent methyltransferase